MHEDDKTNVIVIGSGVAGMNILYQLMASDQKINLICITQEKRYDYSTCGLPYVLEGVVENFENLILHGPEFFEKKDVTLLKNTFVRDLDLKNNQIKIKQGEDETERLKYDYLVITTGRVPVTPSIKGIGLENIYTLMNYADGEKIKEAMTHCKKAVVIGGGLIGLEMAMAFVAKKIETIVVELTPSVLPAMLDPDMGKLVENWLKDKGVKILTKTKVQEFEGSGRVNAVILEDDSELPTDIVILSTGIRPNVELAKKAGIDIGQAGGIKTNEKQCVYKNGQVVENVFASGDCVETKNLITGKHVISALASTAILQSKTITNNILGKETTYIGTVNPSITYLDGLQIGSVGLTTHVAEKVGISYKSATSMGPSQSRYVPGWKNIHFKFLVYNNRMIGAQIIGEKDVKERINTLTLAIREKIPITTLLKTERCYTPPLALLTDPMFKALEQLV